MHATLLIGVVIGVKVDERSDAKRSLFRTSHERSKTTVVPGDSKKISLGYDIDNEIYRKRRQELWPQLVVACAYVDGELAETVEKTVEQLQNY